MGRPVNHASFHLFHGLSWTSAKGGPASALHGYPRTDRRNPEKGAASTWIVVLIAAAGRSGTFSAGQKLITAR